MPALDMERYIGQERDQARMKRVVRTEGSTQFR
jgi:hypothetical protein